LPKQLGDSVLMPSLCTKERCPPLIIPWVQFGAPGQEHLYYINAAFLGCNVQRCGTVFVPEINLGAFVQEQRHNIRVAVGGRQMQRGHLGVIGQVEVTRSLRQIARHLHCVSIAGTSVDFSIGTMLD
jgi:hypothetical protein